MRDLRRGVTPLLVATALGLYALVIVGATVSLAEGAEACGTWPTCHGSWLVPLQDLTLVAVMGHRVLALVVGLLVIAATVAVWAVDGVPGTVRGVLSLVAVLYPLQVGMGAITAIRGGVSPYPTLHLLVAMAIFAGVLAALVWWLESETADVESTFDAVESPDPVAQPSPEAHADPGRFATARAYLELTKPRLMWLLCFVAIAGMGLATATTGIAIEREVFVGTLLGGVLAIGASGTFNHIIERDSDKQMGRTADRPAATETISVRNATIFGVSLAVASLVVFLALANPLAAGLGLVAILFYSVVYTVILKPHTTQNIVLGGAVGAMPALIGWAAVTGSIGLPALVLGGLIFLWTPAHFYNLALAYKRDYARGGFPMLPVARGEAVTLRHIAWYFGATLLAAVALALVAPLGIAYAVATVVFAGIFLLAILALYRERSRAIAMRSFHASNAFLGVVMLIVILETLVF